MTPNLNHTADRHRVLNAINAGHFTQMDTGTTYQLLEHGHLPSRGNQLVVHRLVKADLAGYVDRGEDRNPGTKREVITTTEGADTLALWDVIDPRWVELLDTTWTYDRSTGLIAGRHLELAMVSDAGQEDLDRAAGVIVAALNKGASWEQDTRA